MLPTLTELRAELLQQANELYEGTNVPNRTEFDWRKPTAWYTAYTICRHYGYCTDANGWRLLTKELTGIEPLTQAQRTKISWENRKHQEEVAIIQKDDKIKPQYIPIDDFDISLNISSERVIGNKVYRMLR